MNFLKPGFLAGICIVLIGINLYSLYERNTISKTLRQVSASLVNEKHALHILKDNVRTRELYQFQNEGKAVNGSLQLSYGEEGTQYISLGNLIGSRTKLVFVFSELNCQTCVNQEIENIKKFADQVGSDKVLIIASYRNPRSLYVFKRVHNLTLKVYNKGIQSTGLSIDGLSIPFMFITDNDLKAEYVFLPDKMLPELSEGYFQFVSKFFTEQETSIKL